ncbi:hypothetical protein STEG23_032178 [Scotinomys teguina]
MSSQSNEEGAGDEHTMLIKILHISVKTSHISIIQKPHVAQNYHIVQYILKTEVVDQAKVNQSSRFQGDLQEAWYKWLLRGKTVLRNP